MRLLWTAGPDGVAYVSVGKLLRTGCGRVAVEERSNWTHEARCVTCQAVADAARPPVCPHCRKPMRREVMPAGA